VAQGDTLSKNYATTDELARRLDIDAGSSFDVELSEALDTASRAIDAWCGRVFYADTASTTLYYWPRFDGSWWVVSCEDLHTVTSVKHDAGDDGTYETTLTVTTDYVALPRNGTHAGVSGWPTSALRLRSGFSVRTYGDLEPFQVVGKLGWAAVPDQVRQACLILAQELFKTRDATFGVMQGWNDFGPVRVSADTFKRVRTLLSPFAKMGGLGMPGLA